jgi:hypothetical protein
MASTQNTITCKSTTIDTVGVNLVDFNTGSIAYLPAGNAITEIEVCLRNSALLLAPDSPQNLVIGIIGVSVATFSVTNINAQSYVGAVLPNRVGVNVNTAIRVQSSVANIVAGSIYVVIRYKPISTGDRKL